VTFLQLLEIALYFCFLSLLTVGGGLTVSSDMNRYLVTEKDLLTPSQFTESIALAQAAPGPNIRFVAVLGWQVGGLAGAVLLQIAIVLPSSLLIYHANRWRAGNLQSRAVRAIRTGLSPLAIGFTLSGGWVVAWGAAVGAGALAGTAAQIGMAVLTAGTLAVALTTRINPLWLIGAGALGGVLIL
jgi:chromate transporter